jgi:hypothetical protein
MVVISCRFESGLGQAFFGDQSPDPCKGGNGFPPLEPPTKLSEWVNFVFVDFGDKDNLFSYPVCYWQKDDNTPSSVMWLCDRYALKPSEQVTFLAEDFYSAFPLTRFNFTNDVGDHIFNIKFHLFQLNECILKL